MRSTNAKMGLIRHRRVKTDYLNTPSAGSHHEQTIIRRKSEKDCTEKTDSSPLPLVSHISPLLRETVPVPGMRLKINEDSLRRRHQRPQQDGHAWGNNIESHIISP